jgi:hypothetical protein
MVAFVDESAVPAALAVAKQGQIVEVEELEEDSEEEDGSASEATGLRGWQSCCSSVFAPFTSCVSLSNYVSESVISSTGIVRRHLGRNRLQATPLIPASCFYKACQSSLYSTSDKNSSTVLSIWSRDTEKDLCPLAQWYCG